jgi:lysophospholipase L1-like esterase
MRITATFLLLALPCAGANKIAPDHWVATWACSPSPAIPDAAQMRQRKLEFTDQTVRAIVHITFGGSQFRVRFSNSFGSKELAIGGAHIAVRKSGPSIDLATDRPLTFGGRKAASVPPGADILSDAVSLTAAAASDLAISLYLPGGPSIASTVHYAAHQTSYVAAGDVTAAATVPADNIITSWPYLTGVDVLAPGNVAAIVALGDSITDGSRSTDDANRRWPDVLANRLLKKDAKEKAKKTRFTVVNAGIGGNRILHDGAGPNGPLYGPSALSRLDRDVFSHPGVRYIIFFEGVNDINHPGSAAPMSEDVTAEDMIAGFRQVIERAHELGIRVIGATIMPFSLTPAPQKEEKRQTINQWIRTGNAFDGIVDFDQALRDPNEPSHFAAQYDSGDHLHPNDAGLKVMGEAIDLKLFGK